MYLEFIGLYTSPNTDAFFRVQKEGRLTGLSTPVRFLFATSGSVGTDPRLKCNEPHESLVRTFRGCTGILRIARLTHPIRRPLVMPILHFEHRSTRGYGENRLGLSLPVHGHMHCILVGGAISTA